MLVTGPLNGVRITLAELIAITDMLLFIKKVNYQIV
jgi:hypothetical protein